MNRRARQIGVLAGFGLFFAFGIGTGLAQEVRLDLIPPTQVPGYAEGLQVGGGNLTTLVVMITNYVLGFLGLISITAIIYAGILYVANFGNDEMTGKAKNIITYVAIGILVIILSYAIVNALVGVVGNRSGNVSTPEDSVVTLDALFDVDDKDFIYPIVTTLRDLGDLCPSTPIGLISNDSGCAQGELVADTDADGIANLLDTDDDNDASSDEQDADDDGDGVCDGSKADASCSSGPDKCLDTLSFTTFKAQNIERNKIQVDRVSEDEYRQYIREHQGCAEYQRLNDIDGDNVLDSEDCDADGDGLIDNADCSSAFFNAFPPGNPDSQTVSPDTTFRGVRVFDVIRDETDDDDDNDGVVDFGSVLQPEARELLLRQLANNFNALEQFIRITCATLPQTRKVLDYCGYDPQGQPYGKLVRRLDQLSSDLTFIDFETFNELYQEFISVVKSFPRVQVRINANQFEGSLPTDNTPLTISFDATNTTDPYQNFCSPSDDNYYWFVNKNLDFNQGLSGVLNSTANAPSGKGVFFNHQFTAPGIYNVQLLVRSACKYNIVNPGAAENEDVDAAIAGLASARINVFPARARLVVRVNDQDDPGGVPVRILTGTQGPISFDLTQSVTSRGSFENLNYDCGNGVNNSIQGNQTTWRFNCQYSDATGTKSVLLQARDGEGDVQRTVNLQFSNVISSIEVEPGLQGTTDTSFIFSGTRSSASQQITNYTYIIEQKRGVDFVEIRRFQQQTVSYQFPEPGEYRVTLEVSTGGGVNQVSSDSVIMTILEQEPVAAFRVSFPESIRPARALLDGSLSFHPDFTNTSVLSYIWEVDGVVLQPRTATSSGPFVYEQETAGSDARVFYEFQSVGEHQVGLTVVRGEQRDKIIDTVNVTTLLGVDFVIDTPATRVNDLVTFRPASDKALGFFWDFGDGITLVATDEPVVHKYDKQGVYLVKLTVEDGAGNTNSITKKVRVGLQNAPVPFTQVFVNNIEKDLSLSDCIEVTRNDNVVFDASKSLNIAGQTSGLAYRWEIEDLEEIVQTRTVNRIFKDLTRGGCIDIDLEITDLSTNASVNADTISITVVNKEPEMTDIRFSVSEQDLVTPVTVNVSAVGARDLDGRVTRYRWWYYEEGQGQRKLDQRVTDLARTTFVIGPRNIEGTETTYYFGVEVEDNDGGILNSVTDVAPSKPLVVTNGPNIAPIAEFITDRSTVQTNEIIAFNSTTRDPLGEFIPSAAYQWDFDGDGEFERGISGPRVTHRYNKPGLYRAILKVTKNGLTSQYEMSIRVLPSTKKPEAAFIYIPSGARVKFVSNSQVDPSLEDKQLRLEWDFDTNTDSDGNGISDDDADSALLSPTYEFEGNRDVFVSLKVTDSVGNSDRVTRMIPFIKTDEQRGALGTTKVIRSKPVLTTNPPQHQIDGRVYVRPPFSDVIFNARQSVGKIQEYRLDTNIFVDSDADGIADNDVDNKTHKSWKDGSSFKWTYRESDGRIRAKLTIVDLANQQKSQVVDIIFSEKDPQVNLDQVESPDEILNLFENVPVIGFTLSTPFAQPNQEITFDGSRTKFPNEKVKEYRWDFNGDGLVDEISFEPTFTYAYPEAGVYEAILEAVSEAGMQGEYTQTVFIRGGLALPEAKFEYKLVDNELMVTNASTYDPSFKEEEIQYEWTFTRLDLSTVQEWESWEKIDDYVTGQPEFNQPPLAVRNSVVIEASNEAPGVLPREVMLGIDQWLVRFKEGTTFVGLDGVPYAGSIKFFSEPDAALQIPEKNIVAVYQTGLTDVLSMSDEAQLVFQGVVQNPEVYQIREGLEPILLGSGTVEKNLTVFPLKTFGGRYVLTGTFEEGAEEKGEVLGVSTVKDPVKVFSEAGLYQVTLKIIDPLGEKDETSEVITIDESLQVVEPGTLPPEVPSEEPVVTTPPPQVIPDENGGFSYWWLFFLVFLIGIIGAVAYVVVRTIRKRQEELESRQGQTPSSPGAGVIEPEIVRQPAPEAAAPAAPEKPAEEKKDEPPKPPDQKGPTGPIPDWLKG